jgi:dienelactone hydrolase
LRFRYLQAEADKHVQARREEVAALKTAEDIAARQKRLREQFVASLGGWPDKTPLNPQVTGSERRDGYRIEKVIYESRPNHHVTAILYLPEGKPPFPAVLVPCGHSANGKAAEPYQRISILLAKNGLAALCYDPIGQGERNQLLDEQGKPALAGTSEHTMIGVGALLVGRSTASYRIWDGIRSLDYLASRSDIDPRRLGCTGNSGGGTLTAYLMALDERILAAAPSCYITSLERLFATIGPQDAEQNITGQVAFGMEHADYVTMRAPRPTLICTGTQDYFDIQGAWTTYREAKLLYGALGHGERVDLFEYNDKHGFSQPRREAAMRWMRRWLLDIDDAPRESDFPVAKDAELLCTPGGQVIKDLKGVSAFDLNAQRSAELAGQRSAGPADLAAVRRLIGLPEQIEPVERREVGRIKRGDYEVHKVVFTREAHVPLPALEFVPLATDKSQPLVLLVHGDGKQSAAEPSGPVEELIKQGRRVLAVDLRGMGETSPGQADRRRGAFGADSKEAFLALHLARPLLGQRVSDLLAIADHCKRSNGPDQTVELVGIGSAGPIALHAAALDESISRVTIERSLASWMRVVATPVSRDQLANAVPGALASYDLPQVAAAIAPRPMTIIAPVGAAGEATPLAEFDKEYHTCRQAYQTRGAGEALTVKAATSGGPVE